MRKLLTFLIALGAIVFAVVSPVSAQGFNGGGFNIGLGPFASYQGPGDITFNGSAANIKFYGSCSRVLNNAKASTSTSMCDLVDSSAPTTVLCTLRGTTSGFVDLSAYCTGSVTPATLCAARTGGVCYVSQVYDQSGNGFNLTQTTTLDAPVLSFSAINGLPVMKCTAVVCVPTGGSFTQAQPFVIATVYVRNPSSTVVEQIIGGGTSNTTLASNVLVTANNFACLVTGGGAFVTAADVAWHGGIILFNTTTTSIIGLDGSNTTGTNCGTGTFSAENIRMFRGPGGANQMSGSIAEAMIVGSTASASDFTNWFNNANSTNGYNGAL